jgi:hypothetical protein
MEPNWALYIAIIGTALSVGGAVLLWIDALSLCRTVGQIRYQQLRTTRDLYEHDRHPDDFIVSVGRAPPRGQGYMGPPPMARQTYRPPPSESEVSYSVQSSQSGYYEGERGPPRGPSREPGYNVSRAVNL